MILYVHILILGLVWKKKSTIIIISSSLFLQNFYHDGVDMNWPSYSYSNSVLSDHYYFFR